MRKKLVRNSTSPGNSQSRKPQGCGLASDCQSRKPEKAREYAFFLLKFRLRSEKELFNRLRQKGFPEELCRDTINFLKDREFIDDRIFARNWVSGRIKRPFGFKRIRQELSLRGVDKQVIEEALNSAKENYDESGIVRELARQRFSRLKGVQRHKARQRVYAYLTRRGFSPDLILEAVGGD